MTRRRRPHEIQEARPLRYRVLDALAVLASSVLALFAALLLFLALVYGANGFGREGVRSEYVVPALTAVAGLAPASLAVLPRRWWLAVPLVQLLLIVVATRTA